MFNSFRFSVITKQFMFPSDKDQKFVVETADYKIFVWCVINQNPFMNTLNNNEPNAVSS